jgi:hypothetical protein
LQDKPERNHSKKQSLVFKKSQFKQKRGDLADSLLKAQKTLKQSLREANVKKKPDPDSRNKVTPLATITKNSALSKSTQNFAFSKTTTATPRIG